MLVHYEDSSFSFTTVVVNKFLHPLVDLVDLVDMLKAQCQVLMNEDRIQFVCS